MISKLPESPHSRSIESLIIELKTSERGLRLFDVIDRFDIYGANRLPIQSAQTVFQIFIRQFLNPLIYILGLAALISIYFGDYSDFIFIVIVLLVNAIIGTVQEYSAEKNTLALRKISSSLCMVEREGEVFEIESEKLIPGDMVLLESGGKVPAENVVEGIPSINCFK